MKRKRKQQIHRYKLDEILPYIGESRHSFHVGEKAFSVRMGGQRMLLLGRTQQCAACLIHGKYFALETGGCWPPHFNLYAFNYYGDAVMLTCDHILPRSKGGQSVPDNLQLLCYPCNKVKESSELTLDQILVRRFKDKTLFEQLCKNRPDQLSRWQKLMKKRADKDRKHPDSHSK